MASSGNFSILNPLDNPLSDTTGNTPSNGNLKFTSSGNCCAVSTIGLTFKAYAEVRIESISNYGGEIGLGGGTESNVFYKDNIYFQTNYQSGKAYHYKDGTNQAGSINIGGTVSAGDIIMMCWDPDTFKWWVGVNGTWRNSGDPANGTGFIYQYNSGSGDLWGNGQSNNNSRWSNVCSSANGLTCTWNFGQDSTFGGAVTAGGNADGNGFGDFKYAPPTGFLSTCSGNMVISSDIDPAQTDDDIGSKLCHAGNYQGTNANKSVTIGFQPDLVIFKSADQTGSSTSRGSDSYTSNWWTYDSSRGALKNLMLNHTNDEATVSNTLTSFDTNGFSVGATGETYYGTENALNNLITHRSWRANGGTTSSNSDGDITSTIQANTNAGFSIVKFTSNNTANQTVGHGLGAIPRFILVKPLTGGGWSWWVYHYNNGTLGYLKLAGNDSFTTGTAGFGAHPTSSVFTMGSVGNSMPNDTSTEIIAYVWANVEGYSKFTKYIGNGNADGPFIYTGMQPTIIWIKSSSASGDWSEFTVHDTSINSSYISLKQNPVATRLEQNTGNNRATDCSVDFLSNGFKIRTSDSHINNSGTSYIVMCWGSVPFKYNNTI